MESTPNTIIFSQIAPVIETDLNCALKSIAQEQSDNIEIIKKHQQNKDEFNSCIDAARQSLRHNLQQITKPISVKDYNGSLKKKKTTNGNGEKRNGHISDSDCSMSSEDDDDDSTDCEDEEKLLDEETFLRAKSLRADVRNSIQRIMTLRTEVPKLAVNLTLENIHKHEKQINSIPLRKSNDENNDANIETKSKQDISNIHESLSELSKTIQSLEKVLPEKYDGLHETSDIIESTLQKYLAVAKRGDLSVLSNIERAMMSDKNDGRMERKNEESEKENKFCCDDGGDDGDGLTRLAKFMFL